MKAKNYFFVSIFLLVCLIFCVPQAKFLKDTKADNLCVVNFENNGHGETIEPFECFFGDKLYALRELSENGFVFEGWFKDEQLLNEWEYGSDKVEGDLTLYAKWELEVWDGSILTTFEGSGTSLDPYKIYSVSQLNYISKMVGDNQSNFDGVYFELENDLKFNDDFVSEFDYANGLVKITKSGLSVFVGTKILGQDENSQFFVEPSGLGKVYLFDGEMFFETDALKVDEMGTKIAVDFDPNIEGFEFLLNVFNKIGSDENIFLGNLDGKGFSLKNMFVLGDTNVGLFHSLNSNQTSSLNFENALVVGNKNVGIVAGEGSYFDGCSVNGYSIGNENVGGVFGRFDGIIDEITFEGSVVGNRCVGGIIGLVEDSLRITNIDLCASTFAYDEVLGGVVGGFYTEGNESASLLIYNIIVKGKVSLNSSKMDSFACGVLGGTNDNNNVWIQNVLILSEICGGGSTPYLVANIFDESSKIGFCYALKDLVSGNKFLQNETTNNILIESFNETFDLEMVGGQTVVFGKQATAIDYLNAWVNLNSGEVDYSVFCENEGSVKFCGKMSDQKIKYVFVKKIDFAMEFYTEPTEEFFVVTNSIGVVVPTCDFLRFGQHFECWTDGIDFFFAGETFEKIENMKLYPVWENNFYKIVIDKGSQEENEVLTATYGTAIKIPIPTESGAVCTGFTIGGFNQETALVSFDDKKFVCFDSNIIELQGDNLYLKNLTAIENSTVVLTAIYEPSTYFLNVDYLSKEKENKKLQSLFGEVLVLDADIQKEGYKFVGWKFENLSLTALVSTDNQSFVQLSDGEFETTSKIYLKNLVDSNLGEGKVSAIYEPICYSVKFFGNGADEANSLDDLVLTIKFDEEFALPQNDYRRAGYNFCGWKVYNQNEPIGDLKAEGQSQKNLTALDGDVVTFSAIWTPILYKVRFVNFDGQSTKTKIVAFDEMIELLPVSVYGYDFGSYEICGYDENSAKISLDLNVWKNLLESNQTSQTLFLKNLTTIENYEVVVISAWTPKTFVVHLDPKGGFLPSQDIDVVYGWKYGDLSVPKPYEKVGYDVEFVGWFNSYGEQVDNFSVVDINDNATLYAKWKETKQVYYISYFDSGNIDKMIFSGEPIPEEYFRYSYGDVFVLPEAVKSGYSFLGWFSAFDGGEKITQISETEVGNKVFYARWSKLVSMKKSGDVKVRGLRNIDENWSLNVVSSASLNGFASTVDYSTILNKKVTFLKAFDISFLQNECEIRVDENNLYTVVIDLSEEEAKQNLRVVFLDDDGSVVDMNAVKEGRTISFVTNHFSTYCLLSEEKPLSTPVLVCIVVGGSLVVLILGFVVVWFGFKRRTMGELKTKIKSFFKKDRNKVDAEQKQNLNTIQNEGVMATQNVAVNKPSGTKANIETKINKQKYKRKRTFNLFSMLSDKIDAVKYKIAVDGINREKEREKAEREVEKNRRVVVKSNQQNNSKSKNKKINKSKRKVKRNK